MKRIMMLLVESVVILILAQIPFKAMASEMDHESEYYKLPVLGRCPVDAELKQTVVNGVTDYGKSWGMELPPDVKTAMDTWLPSFVHWVEQDADPGPLPENVSFGFLESGTDLLFMPFCGGKTIGPVRYTGQPEKALIVKDSLGVRWFMPHKCGNGPSPEILFPPQSYVPPVVWGVVPPAADFPPTVVWRDVPPVKEFSFRQDHSVMDRKIAFLSDNVPIVVALGGVLPKETIVAWESHPLDNRHNPINAPVPEPSIILLFGGGFAILAGAARRRNRRKE